MDRSFLVRPEVVAAAKKFVCIRLTSYEDESEKQFVSKLIRGEPANTAFAILTPDGTPALRGRSSGRGPRDLFTDAANLAKGMDVVAAKYPPKEAGGVPALPVTLTAKVGLAVAAGDLQPLVLVLAKNPKRQSELERKVAEAAWDKENAGRFVYAIASSMKELPKVQGQTITEGILFIEPDVFGAGGKVVQEVPGDQGTTQVLAAMRQTLRTHVKAEKSRRQLHVLGLKEGIFYETNIPVSGKGEANDRERYKLELQQQQKRKK